MIQTQSTSEKRSVVSRKVEDKLGHQKRLLIITIMRNVANNFYNYNIDGKALGDWVKKCQQFYEQLENLYKEIPDNGTEGQIFSNQNQAKKDTQSQQCLSKDPKQMKKRLIKEIQKGFRQFKFFNELIRILTVSYFSWVESYPMVRVNFSIPSKTNSIQKQARQIAKFLLIFQGKMRLKEIDPTYFLQEDIQQQLQYTQQQIDSQYIYFLQKFLLSKKINPKQVLCILQNWIYHKNLYQKKIENSSNKTIIHMKKRKSRTPKYPLTQKELQYQKTVEQNKCMIRKHRKKYGCKKIEHFCPIANKLQLYLKNNPGMDNVQENLKKKAIELLKQLQQAQKKDDNSEIKIKKSSQVKKQNFQQANSQLQNAFKDQRQIYEQSETQPQQFQKRQNGQQSLKNLQRQKSKNKMKNNLQRLLQVDNQNQDQWRLISYQMNNKKRAQQQSSNKKKILELTKKKMKQRQLNLNLISFQCQKEKTSSDYKEFIRKKRNLNEEKINK